jgi:hypothetical protein
MVGIEGSVALGWAATASSYPFFVGLAKRFTGGLKKLALLV